MEEVKKEVKPNEWEQMTADQLIDQKTIMLDRYEFMIRKGYKQQAQMILEGVAKIDSLILGH
jgi:hypothetical protein